MPSQARRRTAKLCTEQSAAKSERRAIDNDGRRDDVLTGLIALWPSELADKTIAGRLRVIAKLRSALRAERQRGIAGHWCYSLARHKALLSVYREEVRHIARKRPFEVRANRSRTTKQ